MNLKFDNTMESLQQTPLVLEKGIRHKTCLL